MHAASHGVRASSTSKGPEQSGYTKSDVVVRFSLPDGATWQPKVTRAVAEGVLEGIKKLLADNEHYAGKDDKLDPAIYSNFQFAVIFHLVLLTVCTFPWAACQLDLLTRCGCAYNRGQAAEGTCRSQNSLEDLCLRMVWDSAVISGEFMKCLHRLR
jgi:hypothetical protein